MPVLLATLTLAAAVLVSCSSGDTQTPAEPGEGAADSSAPAAADPEDAVGEPAPAEFAEGEALYNTSCAECHGIGGVGTDQGPPHLSPVYVQSHHGDDAFRGAIANGAIAHHWGFGDMAPVEGLSDADVDQIIGYVRWIQGG